MEDIKVGDLVYGDPDCDTLNSAFYNVIMKVNKVTERPYDKEIVLEVTHVLEVTQESASHLNHTIMAFAVKKVPRLLEVEKDFAERVEYWAKYFNVSMPYRAFQDSYGAIDD